MNDSFWEELLSEIPQELKEDEVTIPMLIRKHGNKVGYKKMQDIVQGWIAEGKVEYIGKRLVNGKPCDAYRRIEKP